jgi:hypothetical protein
VEPERLERLFLVESVEQRCGTEEKAAGSASGGMAMVCLHEGVHTNWVHDLQG